MTTLLLAILAIIVAFTIHVATLSARIEARPDDFLHGGLSTPAWVTAFGSAGVVLAGLNLADHFLLTAIHGLPYGHVALGLVVAASCGALTQKRLWLAAHLSGLSSPGELIGAYYDSSFLRLYLLALLFLFALPLSASGLAQAGALLAAAIDGAIAPGPAFWGSAFFLFLFSVIGGWRAITYAVAASSLLVLALLLLTGAIAASSLGGLPFGLGSTAAPEGGLTGAIPGVLQAAAGIGKSASAGAAWTATAILSFGLAMTGIVLSPGFGLLTITADTRGGFAIGQVWMAAGLAAGALLLIAPLIGAGMGAPDGTVEALAGFARRLGGSGPLIGTCFLVMLLASLQVAVALFVGSAASIATTDLVARFVLPGLDELDRRLAARIALAVIYIAVAAAASFAPLGAVILASPVLSLSVQLLPGFLGLCWLPWISRAGVSTGLIVGSLPVLFTEPLGLVAFEALFIDLPWGRWPLTIHSAGLGARLQPSRPACSCRS